MGITSYCQNEKASQGHEANYPDRHSRNQFSCSSTLCPIKYHVRRFLQFSSLLSQGGFLSLLKYCSVNQQFFSFPEAIDRLSYLIALKANVDFTRLVNEIYYIYQFLRYFKIFYKFEFTLHPRD